MSESTHNKNTETTSSNPTQNVLPLSSPQTNANSYPPLLPRQGIPTNNNIDVYRYANFLQQQQQLQRQQLQQQQLQQFSAGHMMTSMLYPGHGIYPPSYDYIQATQRQRMLNSLTTTALCKPQTFSPPVPLGPQQAASIIQQQSYTLGKDKSCGGNKGIDKLSQAPGSNSSKEKSTLSEKVAPSGDQTNNIYVNKDTIRTTTIESSDMSISSSSDTEGNAAGTGESKEHDKTRISSSSAILNAIRKNNDSSYIDSNATARNKSDVAKTKLAEENEKSKPVSDSGSATLSKSAQVPAIITPTEKITNPPTKPVLITQQQEHQQPQEQREQQKQQRQQQEQEQEQEQEQQEKQHHHHQQQQDVKANASSANTRMPKVHNEQIKQRYEFEVKVPAGKLGLTIENKTGQQALIHGIKSSSILADKVKVGDALIRVDESDTAKLKPNKISDLIISKIKNGNKFLVLRFSRIIIGTASQATVILHSQTKLPNRTTLIPTAVETMAATTTTDDTIKLPEKSFNPRLDSGQKKLTATKVTTPQKQLSEKKKKAPAKKVIAPKKKISTEKMQKKNDLIAKSKLPSPPTPSIDTSPENAKVENAVQASTKELSASSTAAGASGKKTSLCNSDMIEKSRAPSALSEQIILAPVPKPISSAEAADTGTTTEQPVLTPLASTIAAQTLATQKLLPKNKISEKSSSSSVPSEQENIATLPEARDINSTAATSAATGFSSGTNASSENSAAATQTASSEQLSTSQKITTEAFQSTTLYPKMNGILAKAKPTAAATSVVTTNTKDLATAVFTTATTTTTRYSVDTIPIVDTDSTSLVTPADQTQGLAREKTLKSKLFSVRKRRPTKPKSTVPSAAASPVENLPNRNEIEDAPRPVQVSNNSHSVNDENVIEHIDISSESETEIEIASTSTNEHTNTSKIFLDEPALISESPTGLTGEKEAATIFQVAKGEKRCCSKPYPPLSIPFLTVIEMAKNEVTFQSPPTEPTKRRKRAAAKCVISGAVRSGMSIKAKSIAGGFKVIYQAERTPTVNKNGGSAGANANSKIQALSPSDIERHEKPKTDTVKPTNRALSPTGTAAASRADKSTNRALSPTVVDRHKKPTTDVVKSKKRALSPIADGLQVYGMSAADKVKSRKRASSPHSYNEKAMCVQLTKPVENNETKNIGKSRMKSNLSLKPPMPTGQQRTKSPNNHPTTISPSKAESPTNAQEQQKRVINKAIEVECCAPDEPLEGGWPAGWLRRKLRRQGGALKGRDDKYWYSPITEKKFRSMTEVKRFLQLLQESNGNEEVAFKKFRSK